MPHMSCAFVTVSSKKEQKRHFVTTYQLQQQKKFKRKSIVIGQLKNTAQLKYTASPDMLKRKKNESNKVEGSATRRKLDLELNACDDEASEDSQDNAISAEVYFLVIYYDSFFSYTVIYYDSFFFMDVYCRTWRRHHHYH